MQFSIFSAVLFSAAATAKIIEIQAGNPTAPTGPEKLTFIPDVVEAAPEDTIRFIFNGEHTVTQQGDFNQCAPGAPDGVTGFDSGRKAAGETFDIPAEAMVPGAIINYYCKINEGAHCSDPNFMQGAIVITDPNADPAGDPNADPAGDPNADPAGDPNADPAGDPNADPAAATDPNADPNADPAAATDPAAVADGAIAEAATDLGEEVGDAPPGTVRSGAASSGAASFAVVAAAAGAALFLA